ncbi:MAG: phosphoribosylaminoimidazolecarboxamide formyltransferase [Synergistaceae bacterium]|nr:phosphoribosylaminoimidazolecarboxamide formyltransferase [Synergistaceae bacterium]
MTELELKYGCNPGQRPARIFMRDGGALPIEVLDGRPGYINFLDALNGWQLVRDLRRALGLPAAASFKHVSPAGAALGLPLTEEERLVLVVDLPLADVNASPLACAYARARGTDRVSSFGDWIALSDPCDATTARVIQHEVSDGIIAPGFSDEALAILRAKRKGAYAIVRIDPDWEPPSIERRDVFGVTFEQGRDDAPPIDPTMFDHAVTRAKDIPEAARRDLTLALVTTRYTQSNSVCLAKDGQTLGVGAGQQSRLHCTRLASDKADLRLLRAHPKVLALPFAPGLARPERDNAVDAYLGPSSDLLADDAWRRCFTARPEPLSPEERRAFLDGVRGASLASDAFFPFPDSVERARRSGTSYVAQPGGSIRDALVIEACDRWGIAMVMTGRRLFHH